ncbi:MAG: nucleotidyltransferase domain-containing protein [Chloroflexi bacterium]|nr:nucleotidyltransferase domain-containing protein [Chloroflexota bacterium]
MDETVAVNAQIQSIIRCLVEKYQPEFVILFGSQAYGEPDEDSDIDLLIVKSTMETPLQRRVQVRQLVSDAHRRIPFSPLVLTPEELAQRLAIRDPFYVDIMHKGKVLYWCKRRHCKVK